MGNASNRRAAIEGCLLGCAVGDSLCLPYEGMTPRRLNRLLEFPLRRRLFFGRGMVSDDTDHSVFVGQALARHSNDSDAFARCLAWRLRCWLLCLPAGIGFATLKSILRLWCGVPPSRSGVFSAGNGAAMRSALIGVFHCDDTALRRRFVRASSIITHSDPRAEHGAQAVADLAAFAARNGAKPTASELETILSGAGEGAEWRETVDRTVAACLAGAVGNALPPGGGQRGVSGFILHTLPVAVTAWHVHFGDFRKTIEAIAPLGGDTDTVAAIAGSLAGVTCGRKGIPGHWITGIADRPHGVDYLTRLSGCIAGEQPADTSFSWLLFPRGLLFTAIVLGHALKRLLPPW